MLTCKYFLRRIRKSHLDVKVTGSITYVVQNRQEPIESANVLLYSIPLAYLIRNPNILCVKSILADDPDNTVLLDYDTPLLCL
jgi:hypothetical protein